ncbi:glycoside hydrolase family 27 protein [Cucurbitaria berberidis CBS 394.84]|uniref:Alpha-galactosidase n=1 Tax=Cucurbitaria berberidis CBS 394.84 TaxID=1168544 RepID=A0A9P4GAL8_9PLEO|nr:glycoside hydrolase family 27 protein [Cucurbitaria berberidis CBS 394.84]KAF1841932.1 glycoside hydrolase family 27 protein [Cucurbitaria berberidis CBS 394.84]
MALRFAFIELALFGLGSALVSKDGVTGRLPAMGWNSWNEYECAINETVFLTVGELLVSLGLKDLGYTHVNIDDCWSDKEIQRDNVTGKINPDYKKFPQGIKHTADEIHKLGLKLGIYGDAGTLTCALYAGSLGHEELDAQTFAEWGIDYLKYDNCNVPHEWDDEYRWWPDNWRGGPPNEDQTAGGVGDSNQAVAPPGYDWTTSKTFDRYKTMRDALLATNRTIEYSQCAWGHAHIDEWGNSTGHSWRMWGDIHPVWPVVTTILNHAAFFYNSSNFWGHADYDMLEVGNGDLTIEENRSHFAMWAALKSPLIIGTPLDGIKPEILAILANKELIAFNQDPIHGESAKPYKWGVNPDFSWNQSHPAEYWSGESSKGTHVFVLNTLDTTQNKTVDFAEVPGLDAKTEYTVIDSWTGKEQGRFQGKYHAVVERHDTMAIRIVKAGSSGYNFQKILW